MNTDPKKIQEFGYALLPKYKADEDSESVISALGTVDQVADYEPIHSLTPKSQDHASTNSYSGNFGYEAFPYHSDFAHWFTPPRYMILRCVVGTPDVFTLLVDTTPLLSEANENDVSRILAKPRKPINGKRSLLKIYDPASRIFRWDPLFLEPESSRGIDSWKETNRQILIIPALKLLLSDSGDTLLIDNWRMLHGRSAVSAPNRSRHIQRAYLSSLHE